MVEIRSESKRYTCFINIQGKITIIKGDSGPMYLETSAKGQVLHMAHPNGRLCGAKRPKCEAERSPRL